MTLQRKRSKKTVKKIMRKRKFQELVNAPEGFLYVN